MSTPPPPTQPPGVRYHDFDALRGFAMLLGIALHAMLSFIDLPFWPAQDLIQNSTVFGFFQHAIHGFRMPLFFLVSGFFTAMLWRKRGLAALIKHRAIRILIPLVVGLILLWPLMIGVSIWGGISKAAIAEQRANLADGDTVSIWYAVKEGDSTAVIQALDEGTDPNGRDGMGISPLSWAAMLGHVDVMNVLIERGVDVDTTNSDGSTSLHGAVFFGQHAAVVFLLEHGADTHAKNNEGDIPEDNLIHPWGIVKWISGMLSIEVEKDQVMAGREEIVELLRADPAGTDPVEEPDTEDGLTSLLGRVARLWTLGAMIPIFQHLWFLHYLCMLLVVFILVAAVMNKTSWTIPACLVRSPLCWLWVLPLTLAAQLFMFQTFGPDTAAGILPWPPKLAYYAVFFGFGALCYGKTDFHERAGAWWPLWLVLSLPVLVGGLYCYQHRAEHFAMYHAGCSVLAVLYVWMMIFGLIGLFRRFCATENPTLRYLSDSSYWLYLVHLPLVLALQIVVSPWLLPAGIKFLLVCLVATTLLLVTYEFCVRYTVIGTVLNGRKVRTTRKPKQIPDSF